MVYYPRSVVRSTAFSRASTRCARSVSYSCLMSGTMRHSASSPDVLKGRVLCTTIFLVFRFLRYFRLYPYSVSRSRSRAHLSPRVLARNSYATNSANSSALKPQPNHRSRPPLLGLTASFNFSISASRPYQPRFLSHRHHHPKCPSTQTTSPTFNPSSGLLTQKSTPSRISSKSSSIL